MKPGKRLILLGALTLTAAALASTPARAGLERGQLKAPLTLAAPQAPSGVRLALADLARDLQKVLGAAPAIQQNGSADLVVRIDPALASPEAWRIEITGRAVRISGADELGAIYGIYQFSQRFLGVDPFYFWKDREPQPQTAITLAPQTITSTPATFRWRGWFVNDEDLLTEWKDGGGRRFIDYPFYAQVVHPGVIDRVFESLLRAGGNLVIPASFVDVMNPPEAALVRRAAQRGLHVSQHHIEPLGVSYFGFQNFWKARGEQLAMSYSTQPEKVREAWRAYAAKWRELAGDKVVWQLGLRGRADSPVWSADKGVTRAEAGALISRAMADQWKIVRAVDPRPQPPATTTLWMEGSELMREGSLTIPEGVTIVFSDDGQAQAMQEDFYKTPRRPGAAYGVYYHIAYWSNGPHLVQGMSPQRIGRFFDGIAAKGDTHFAIINVSNVREHVLGVQAATENMVGHAGWDPARFMERFAPPVLLPRYQAFWNCFVPLERGRILQDGFLFAISRDLRKALASPAGKKAVPHAKLSGELQTSIARLDQLIRDYPSAKLSPAEREFFDVNLLLQAQVLRGLYKYVAELILAVEDRSHVASARQALAEVIELRRRAGQGKWENWYRGDRKMNLPRWLEETR